MQKSLRLESMEGCNSSNNNLALSKEGILSSNTYTSKRLPYGFQICFFSKNRMRTMRWWDIMCDIEQGFTQRPNIGFNETYSPDMIGITF